MVCMRCLGLVIVLVILPLFDAGWGFGKEKYRVLFDAGHAESAGKHADWIIDDDTPIPMPKDPKSEKDWSGGISSWAYELYKTGRYEVESTVKPLTCGDFNNSQDLSGFRVLILCEPNRDLGASERKAIITFVNEGGGLFLVANHYNSDRNNDGIDSTGIFNHLEKVTGIHFQTKGEPNAWVKGGHCTANFPLIIEEEEYLIFKGPFGLVKRVCLNGFGTLRILKDFNPTAKGYMWMSNASQTERNILLATAKLGSGRIVAFSDSSVVDDGTTTTPGRRLYNGWLAEGAQNGRLTLNITEFLAKN